MKYGHKWADLTILEDDSEREIMKKKARGIESWKTYFLIRVDVNIKEKWIKCWVN